MRYQGLSSALARPVGWKRPANGAEGGRRVERRIARRAPRLLSRAVVGLAVLLLVTAGGLWLLRQAHAGRVYPAVYAAGEPLGGLTRDEARAALAKRGAAVESASVAFSHGDRRWSATLGELGVRADPEPALAAAYAVGRQDGAWDRLRATAGLVRDDERFPMALALDHAPLGRWFDRIDRDIGQPPREARLEIEGTEVSVVPEADGVVVDRATATARLTDALRGLRPVDAPLPTLTRPAAVRADDLGEARDRLAGALDQSVQVSFEGGYWTLASSALAGFVEQEVDPEESGAAAFSMGLDEARLADWLAETLAPELERDPVDAVVGWGGEGLVSVEQSVDGVRLKPEPLAESIAESFFGDHDPVEAPVTITKPAIDSGNLDKLGVATLLGVGTSNYSGSTDGRATNVEVGAYRLNGTLVPPNGEFSFNHAIGVIKEENGFVKAQVIDGERIGQDIGGGICQVSTTVFRAAYMAGLQMGDWWPHLYRIPFYEYDGWPPGLDASILQPTEDPSTWGDFTFLNPSDSWMLVESWTDGVNVVVNVYGADLGYRVETTGPTYGQPVQIEPDLEVVDPELEPGTVKQTETPLEGLSVRHMRTVFDRAGNRLREGPFDTEYAPRGNVWTVSPDMKGKSPADPERPLPKPSTPPRDESAMADSAAGEAVVGDVPVVEDPAAVPVEE